jgi:signal transduction histidine kinase
VLSRGPLAALLLLSQVPSPPAEAPRSHKHVLVLHSTRRDAQIAVVAESALTKALDAGLARNLDYHSEFLDLARFPDAAYRAGFRDFLRLKYQGVRFDVVIALQDTAIEFIDEYGAGVFPDVPVVFLSNTLRGQNRANTTGVIHERDFASTVAFIRRAQPDIRTLFIVTGAGPADRQYEAEIRRQLQGATSGLDLVFLSGMPTPELEQRLAQLPSRSAVYYVLVTQDGAGHRYHPLDYVDRVAGAASAPTYSWVDSTMERGIVGGSLYRQLGAIEPVGQLALRVLRGESAGRIPVEHLRLNSVQADWRQLRRWGIPEWRLPADTAIAFRELSIWDRYRFYVFGALTLVITQAVLITGLLIQRGRRRHAEDRNRDLCARLVEAHEVERGRVARDVHDRLGQSLTALKMDLQYVNRRLSAGDRPGVEQRLGEMTAVVDEAVDEVRRVAGELRPVILDDDFGIVALMRTYLHDVERRSGLACALSTNRPELSISDDRATALFRILQEATTNVVRHARATRVDVELAADARTLRLVVRDDGCGIAADQQRNPRALGLIGMQDRALLFGGEVDVTTNQSGGTIVTARLPLHGAAT